MVGSVSRIVLATSTVVTIGVLSACASAGSEPASPASSAAPAPPSPSPVPSELTAEENLSINPPAPTTVRGDITETTVRLSWQLPPKVTVPHRYSDRVTGYRIYRRGPGELDLRPIGTSEGLTFTDRAPGSGEFAYAVTSIRENNVEGTKSDPPVTLHIS